VKSPLTASSDQSHPSGQPQVDVLPRIAGGNRRLVSALALLTCAALLPAAAFAGSAAGSGVKLILHIAEEGRATPWSEDISGILQFNPTTGALSMPTVFDEAWTARGWENVAGNNQPITTLKWHSAETVVEGDPSTPWRTIFTLDSIAGNVDPFMTYSFSAKNNTSMTQTYTFTYGEALVPTVLGGYSVQADIAGSVTNAPASGTAKVAPVILDANGDGDGVAEIQVLRLSTDGGVTFTNAGVDVGLALETTNFGTTGYGNPAPAPFSDTTIGTAAVAFNYWEITTQFTLSPGKDSAAFSGFVELIPDSEANIPEPSTYALLVAAIALGATVWKRRTAVSYTEA